MLTFYKPIETRFDTDAQRDRQREREHRDLRFAITDPIGFTWSVKCQLVPPFGK